jgi:hypothetical protein
MLNMMKCFIIKPQGILIFPASIDWRKKTLGIYGINGFTRVLENPGYPGYTGVNPGENGLTIVLNYEKTTSRNSRLVVPEQIRTVLHLSAFF